MVRTKPGTCLSDNIALGGSDGHRGVVRQSYKDGAVVVDVQHTDGHQGLRHALLFTTSLQEVIQ